MVFSFYHRSFIFLYLFFLSSFDAGSFYAVYFRFAAGLYLISRCSIRVCTYLMSSNLHVIFFG